MYKNMFLHLKLFYLFVPPVGRVLLQLREELVSERSCDGFKLGANLYFQSLCSELNFVFTINIF